MISVLTTNVFPGTKQLELMIKCLAQQTVQDFEWILLDGHCQRNQEVVKNLCEKFDLKDVKHLPLCKAIHIGRRFHWEVYNNALMLAKNNLFLRMGVYRWFHKKTLEWVIQNYQKGIFTDFSHVTKPIEEFEDQHPDKIYEMFKPRFNNLRQIMCCSSGMFSFTRENMLKINGNDEAATTMIHHEDADMNSRWIHLPGIQSQTISHAMFRIEHDKSPNSIIPELEEPNSYCCEKEFCLVNYPNTFDLEFNPPTNDYRFSYRNFDWKFCPHCNAVAPINSDEYLIYLRNNPETMIAPIGVNGIVGRDIRILFDDIQKLNSDQEKLELLKSSHQNQRYLFDTQSKKKFEVKSNRYEFIREIKDVCEKEKILIITRPQLYAFWVKNKEIRNKYILPKKDFNSYIFDILESLIQNLDKKDFDSVLFLSCFNL